MENSIASIIFRIHALTQELMVNYNGTIEDVQIEVVNDAAEELLAVLDINSIKRAFVNMYFAGLLMGNETHKHENKQFKINK